MNTAMLRRLPAHLSACAKQSPAIVKPRLTTPSFAQRPIVSSRASTRLHQTPLISRRHKHSESSSTPSTQSNTRQPQQQEEQQQQRSPLRNSTTQRDSPLPHKPAPHRDPNEPIYQLTFTCKPCSQRSSHTISKQGYHHGTVLITCPGCKNRHLIADHLHIFSDQKVTLEDIMRQHGENVQRGSITPEGDVEFWAEDAQALEDVQAKAAAAAKGAREAQLASKS